MVKTVTAHLSVLLMYRVQVWIHSFNFLKKKKREQLVSGTCRCYVSKRYKCAEEGCEKGPKREGTVADFLEPFLINSDRKSI